MSKISGWNFSQNITSADNCKQKNEDLDTWYVGMNDFARIAGGQNSRSNILSPRAFLEFLAKIFTLGYVDFSKRSNEAGTNMMAHIKSSSYIKNNDGSEIMKFVMNNPEGERADLSKVEIEITLASAFNNGIREGHTVIIFPQPDGSTNRYEGKSFERKDESSLHLITNKILACYQREANKEIARLLNIPQELNNSQDLNNSQVSCKDSVDSTITDLLEKPLNNALLAIRKEHLLLMPYVCNESISYLLGEKGILKEIDSADRDAVIDVVRKSGALDILVVNAGIGVFGEALELNADDIDRLFKINIHAPYHASVEAARQMPEGGRILIIGSVNGDRMPVAGMAAYAASKSALQGMARGLARDFGPRGITINVVHPGPIDTDANPANGPMRDMLHSLMAIKRHGQPEEVAGMVAWLAGPEASFVTGAMHTIDGAFGA